MSRADTSLGREHSLNVRPSFAIDVAALVALQNQSCEKQSGPSKVVQKVVQKVRFYMFVQFVVQLFVQLLQIGVSQSLSSNLRSQLFYSLVPES